MTPSEAPTTTNPYALNSGQSQEPGATLGTALKRLGPLMIQERGRMVAAFVALVVSSAAGLTAPVVIGRAVDTYMRQGDYGGVLRSALILMGAYLVGLVAAYIQTLQMGTVGRNVLFNVRNALFAKLQQLPVDFFNQNKAGDLISRINSDTDKLNQFFAQALVQLGSNLIMMTGAAIFLLTLHPTLGAAALLPALAVLVLTRATGQWVRSRNTASLQALGGLSGEVQESISNFRVIVAFNRADYFRERFSLANDRNYNSAVRAGLASTVFLPAYGLALNFAQIIVLAYGFYLITNGALTVGLLIGFLLYVNSFYMPLRQLAVIWSSFQLAMSSLDRISEVLALEPNMPQLPPEPAPAVGAPVLAFDHVAFSYPGGAEVLTDVTFALERGKTYALVGPTGGGKTTTASLMARLYDPTSGRVLLDGRDIRTFTPEERTRKIGFILQEPFLFTGTVRDNILYGNTDLQRLTNDELTARLVEAKLTDLLARFDEGLETKVTTIGDGVSLGQKQLVAFMRAVLREPDILVLDEATANVDTVTEQLLEQILRELPASTTKVVIAHRLNTIENADAIFFINSRTVSLAGSMENALELLLHGKRES
ncbi:MAG TPA: ABC transporter ATP-binding protein [Vicinamibacterales bacterium]|nr:ABC transporter ATP-binding protein [Vicinamibacterales bacterium]